LSGDRRPQNGLPENTFVLLLKFQCTAGISGRSSFLFDVIEAQRGGPGNESTTQDRGKRAENRRRSMACNLSPAP
jgi:hypothetical protein